MIDATFIGIGDIGAMKGEVLIVRKKRQPGLFQRHIIIVVDDVDPDDALASREQRRRDMKTDETGGPGDNHGHERHPLNRPGRVSRPGLLGVEIAACKATDQRSQ
jgi:hypothetical protein